MKANVGGVDRVVRLVVGIVLLALGIFAISGVWQWLSIIVGAILLLTSLISFCPINSLLGVNTAKKGEEEAPRTA
jgi:ABC-type transport system involved in multi-copper enzyme maturation permease subunit